MALVYPQIDPVLIHIGPIPIRWYGLMYLVGFGLAYLLGCYRLRQHPSWTKEALGDLIFYGAIGAIVGGRLGYMLFYGFAAIAQDPLAIFRVWEGGMSFHGGLLGAIAGVLWFCHQYQKPFFAVTDFAAPLVPLGLGAGRIANFINGELWGRPTDLPWGMIFPHVDQLPRHPSQIYQCLGEGVLLFIICWSFSAKTRPRMAVSGLFMLSYGSIRFLLEFFRQPDAQLGFIALNWLTMGQLLSIPMILLGAGLLARAYCQRGTLTCNNT